MVQNITFVEPVLVGVTIQENSCYCGINLKNIQLPEKCIFLGIARKDEVILASAEEITLRWGDYVMAIAFKPALAPALKVLLKKTHPVSWSP
jgi:Trk K+ transport system NAD-binding subunit